MWKVCLSEFKLGKQAGKCLFPPLPGHMPCFHFHKHKAERRIGNVVSTYTELGCDCSISLDPPAGETAQCTCSTWDSRSSSGQEETHCFAPPGKPLPTPAQFRKRVNTSLQKPKDTLAGILAKLPPALIPICLLLPACLRRIHNDSAGSASPLVLCCEECRGTYGYLVPLCPH